MNKVKATNTLTLKKILGKQHPDMEAKLRADLSPEQLNIYEYSTVSTWITDLEEKGILEIGARLLFPNHTKAMVQLGRALALETMSGLYSVFLRIPSVSFVMQRTANMWRLFNAAGNARTEDLGPGRAAMTVTEAPDFQLYQCDLVTGYIQAVLELTGTKNISVVFLGHNPAAWRWEIAWSPNR
jgi:hypothetical protein